MKKILILFIATVLATAMLQAQTPTKAVADANETFQFKTNKGTLNLRTVGTPSFKGINNCLKDNYEATAWIMDKASYYTVFNKVEFRTIEAHQSYGKNKVLFYNWDTDTHVVMTDKSNGYIPNPYVNTTPDITDIESDLPMTDILGYIMCLRISPEQVFKGVYGIVDRGVLYKAHTKVVNTPKEKTYIITLENGRTRGSVVVSFSNDARRVPLSFDAAMPKYKIKGELFL